MKSILLHVHGDDGQESRLAAALAIVRAFDGRLDCIQVMPLSAVFVAEPMGGAYMAGSLYEMFEKQQSEDRAALEARLNEMDTACQWSEFDGDVAQTIVSRSRLSDVIVLSQADYQRGAGLHPIPIIADVATNARAPVLAVPIKMKAPFNPDGMAMVAWNGSPEAANALRAALPMLRRAKSVVLVTVGDDASGYPSAAATDYLKQHGISAQHRNVGLMGEEIGEALVDIGASLDASYIVMGAYGHSRFREALLGGATRYMLAHSQLPLLMTH
jgi:nucleotide-binding universal stress UspA family protein